MSLVETLKSLAGKSLTDEDGQAITLALSPPATPEDIKQLEMRLVSPLPKDVREALLVATGLEICDRIWEQNPGAMTQPDAAASNDKRLADFGKELDPTALVVDLRQARVGDGFSWGRFGPQIKWQRWGKEPVWAVVPPPPKQGLLGRLFKKG